MRVWEDYSLELKRDVTASKNTDLKNHKALMNGIAAKNAQKAEKTFTGTRENTQGLWMRQSWWSVGNTASVQLLEENWNTQLEFGSKKQKLYVKFDTGLPDVATIHRRRRRRKTWKDISCGYVSANTEEKGYTDSITIGGIEVKDVWIRVSNNAFLNMNRDAGL